MWIEITGSLILCILSAGSILELQVYLLFHSIHPSVALQVENSAPVYMLRLVPSPLSSESDSLDNSLLLSA